MRYSVELIREEAESKCDLLAWLGDERLWIEVKSSVPEETDLEKLSRNESVRHERPAAFRGNMHEILCKAADQIRSTAKPGDGFPVVWVKVVDPGGMPRLTQWYATLMGIDWIRIIGWPFRDGVNIIPCFFARRSWFEDQPEVPGVVIESFGRIALYPNPFCERTEALRMTHFYKTLRGFEAVFDLCPFQPHDHLYVVEPSLAALGIPGAMRSLSDRYRISVQRTKAVASSTAGPNSETGEIPGIPGMDCGVSWVHLHTHFQGRG